MDEAQVKSIVEKVVNQLLSSVSQSNRLFQKIAIGCDHGGFEHKQYLVAELGRLGYGVDDKGTHSKDAVDYPDYAYAVAHAVSSKKVEMGIIIDGAGIGSSMCANKVRGIRAALCYSEKTILNSRLHNAANVLTLGAGYHTAEEMLKLIQLWLTTDFEGGRHQPRIDKMMALESQW